MRDADTGTAVVPEPGADVHEAVFPNEVVGPYSKLHSVPAPPLGFTVAFTVAVVEAIDDAGLVSTAGAFGSVVKLASEPLLVPPVLTATTRKWYGRLAINPVTGADTATEPSPAFGKVVQEAFFP